MMTRNRTENKLAFCVKQKSGLIVRTTNPLLWATGVHTTKSAWKAQTRLFARKAKSNLEHGGKEHRSIIHAIKKGYAKITQLCKTALRIEYRTDRWKDLLGNVQTCLIYTLFYQSAV